jgi:chromosome segregation ATPase
MLGLLAKAANLRKSLGLPSDGRDEFAFDPDSGISREDQKEILQEIEKVATQSRISVSPEVFVVKAAKKGVLFPIIVNAAAIAALAIGLGTFWFLFQRGETQLAKETAGGITAEGKLIEELKKESEAQLQEKNLQINEIQGQLAQIDKEKQNLQSTMDEKVRERETQLRAAVAADLEAEREKLRRQGLSDQDIAKRLSDLEVKKNSEFAAQLEAFRGQAEEDRKKAEASLRQLEGEFTANLARANEERQKVLADSKKREEDLRSQLEAKTRDLESEKAKAEQALKALASQKEKEDLATGQLVGMYSVAKADIAARNYTKALQSLRAIRDYVNQEEVVMLPGIARRREVDLFVVDSLSGLVQGELDKGKVDTGSLMAAANQVADIREKVGSADAQARAGRVAEAENLYGEALAVIPEIAKSYSFFASREKETASGREEALRAGLTRAESAFDAGRFSDALAAYRDALAYLPEPPARLDRMLSSVESAGVELGKQKTQSEQSRAAAPILAQAASLQKQESYDEALAQYLSILARSPQSAQAEAAVKGVGESAKAMSARADAKLAAREKELFGQIAAIQKDLQARLAEIASMKKEIAAMLGGKIDPDAMDSASLLAALRGKFGALEAAGQSSDGTAAGLQKRLDEAGATISGLRAEKAELERQRADLVRERAELNARLAAALQGAAGQQGSAGQQAAAEQPAAAGLAEEDARRLANLDRMIAGYQSYATREDAILSDRSATGLMKTKPIRDGFLASVEELFPRLRGLLVRMKTYDSGFEEAGRENGRIDALQGVIDVVVEVSRRTGAKERASYFEQKNTAYEKDPQMKNFLKTLQGLLK